MFLINSHFFSTLSRRIFLAKRRICQYRNTHVVHSIYGTEKINSFYNEKRRFLFLFFTACVTSPYLGCKATLDPSQRSYVRKVLGMTRANGKKNSEEKVVTTCGGMVEIGVDDNNPSAIGKLFSYVCNEEKLL